MLKGIAPWKLALSVALAFGLGLWIFGPILFHETPDLTTNWVGKKLPEGEVFREPEVKMPVKELLTGPKNILSFWAEWCAPCVAEMPEINRHALELEKAGIHVSMVNVAQGIPDKIYPEMQAWLISQKLSLKTVYDFNSLYMDRLEVPSLPLHVGIDAEGTVLWMREGAMRWDLKSIEKNF